MEAEKNIVSFLNPNVQLDRFDGTNFIRWKGKLFFLLTVLKIAYVLDPNLQPLSEPDDVTNTDELKVERKKRAKDVVMCQGYILNTLSDMLYDFYSSVETPKKIWTALEYKYKAEKEVHHVETKPVLNQIHELQIMVTKLHELKVEISESFQVGAIITQLPPSWNDYRKKLLHRRDAISLEELQKHLRIEEETKSRDKKNVPHDSSKVNIVEGSNRKRKNDQKNNNTNNKFKKISNNKKIFSENCFNCGKKGHHISDCKFRKNGSWKKEDNNSNTANVVEDPNEKLVAMVSEMHIGMII
ncbi:hypothetical protein UlMin_017256 [Ulmus minor]